jgi:hypothetical protein
MTAAAGAAANMARLNLSFGWFNIVRGITQSWFCCQRPFCNCVIILTHSTTAVFCCLLICPLSMQWAEEAKEGLAW